MTRPLPPVECWDEVDSTNRIAAEWLRAGCLHGRALRARSQTAGRGRLGRSWTAPPDSGLTLSVVLAGPEWFALAPRIPLAAGVACADLLRDRYDAPVGLKWPNDLVFGRRKCGGILCEGVTNGGRFAGIVIGIGLNINADEEALGVELAGRATSLFLETGRTEADLDGLAAALRDAIVAAAEALTTAPPERLLARWAELDSIRGREVWFGEGDAATSGIAEGIAQDGGLLVRTADGLRTLHAGEVTTQPPADTR